ncbi:hypothetical protein FRC02_010973 [Tulasnella sp. 418]|nr:hypothetical protein FRC02_010973 [Tulasnella sp. 418]
MITASVSQMRFARGLPPISPARRRGGVLTPRTSPGVCLSGGNRGRIKFTTSNGQIGYIKGGTTPNTNGGLETTNVPSKALQVSSIFDGTTPPPFFRIETRESFAGYPPNIGGTVGLGTFSI